MHPLVASSEYTTPLWLPMNSRPPAIAGCAHADAVSGNPNAHFSRSFATCAAVSPACSAGWKCVFSSDAPQPFQNGAAEGSPSGIRFPHVPTAAPVTVPRSLRPLTYSAIARRSSPLSARPWYRIDPAVSASTIACGDRRRSASSVGARGASALWQVPHAASNKALPSGASEPAGRASRAMSGSVKIAEAVRWRRARSRGPSVTLRTMIGLRRRKDHAEQLPSSVAPEERAAVGLARLQIRLQHVERVHHAVGDVLAHRLRRVDAPPVDQRVGEILMAAHRMI